MKCLRLRKIASRTVQFLGGVALIAIFLSTPLHAKTKAKKKRAAKISWEQCCEKNDGDTEMCQKMKRVKGKKEKIGKKWVAKSCPEPEPMEDSMDDEGDSY